MVCIGPCERCVSGFHYPARVRLFYLANRLKVDGRLVPVEEIVHTESHLALLGAKLCRDEFPYRTPAQIRAELLRLSDKYDRKVLNGTEAERSFYGGCRLWIMSSDDADDFMPSSKERRVEAERKKAAAEAATSSKCKGAASSNDKGESSSKRKSDSSSKRKSDSSSKRKSDAGGCIDGR